MTSAANMLLGQAEGKPAPGPAYPGPATAPAQGHHRHPRHKRRPKPHPRPEPPRHDEDGQDGASSFDPGERVKVLKIRL
jgi:hypothetical protein